MDYEPLVEGPPRQPIEASHAPVSALGAAFAPG